MTTAEIIAMLNQLNLSDLSDEELSSLRTALSTKNSEITRIIWCKKHCSSHIPLDPDITE